MGYYTNDKSTKTSSLANPTSLNLQPRPFAPLESDEKEETVARKSGYSENFLEKIINTPRSESATPVQRKSGNRLKAIAAERNNAALQNQSIQRQESVEEKNEGKQEVAKEFIMNPEPPPVQRKLENHLRAKNAQRMAIQAKLAIGEPNDKYEQEADATAARVVQQINSPITSQSQPVQRKFENHLRAKNAQKMAIQPKLAIGDPNGKYEQEDDATAARGIQQINSPTNNASTASLTQPVQRQEMQEDEELQMKSLVQRRENIGGGEASTDLESSIQSARGSGQSLDANLQRSMGQAMGADFSGVKVHTDSQSDQLNQSIQAKAFTTGQDVFFRQGAYEPSSRGGQELIAHELTHVVQQNGGAVQRSPELQTKPLVSSITPLIQRDDTLKHSDAQTTVAKDYEVSDADKAKTKNITSGASDLATKHPMYSTFQARINGLFSEFPAPPGLDIKLLTRNIWMQICQGIDASNPELERRADNTTYLNSDKGYVDLESPGYLRALSEFDGVMATLKQATKSQFVKAKSFGFWSKSEGRAFAEEKCDLTLETSGLGALFDGMPSLNAHANGWDVQLWGSLSRAFGQAVAQEMRHKDKSVHVCIGGETAKNNIFGAVESKALEKGASAIGKTLEEAVTFHAVAAKSKTQRQPDWSVKGGDLPGTWYSGHSWDTALDTVNANYATLPESIP